MKLLKFKKRWLILIGALLAILGFPAVLWLNQNQQIDVKLNKIRSTGQATSLLDLLKTYNPPVRDTTELWMKAFSLLGKIGIGDLKTLKMLPYVGSANEIEREIENGNWKNIQLAEEYLQQRSGVLELLHLAADRSGGARFPTYNDEEKWFRSPEGIHTSFALLKLETHYFAFRGEPEQSIKALCSRLALAQSIANRPNYSTQILRMSSASLTLRDLEKYLPRLTFSEAALLQIQTRIRQLNPNQGLTLLLTAFRGERVYVFHNPEKTQSFIKYSSYESKNFATAIPASELEQFVHDMKTDWRKKQPAPHSFGFWLLSEQRDFLQFLNISTDLISASTHAWPKAFEEATEIEKRMAAFRINQEPGLFSIALPYPVSLFAYVGQKMAQNHVYDTAIAVELYRRRAGEMPKHLHNLVPEFLPSVPIDPFSGNPVLFIKKNDGFIVYSIGKDRVDNGGDGSRFGQEPDVTCYFHLPK